MKFINLLSIYNSANAYGDILSLLAVSFTEQFSFSFSYLIQQ